MNIMQLVKRLGTGIIILSSSAFIASPIASLFGIDQLATQDVSGAISAFILIGIAILIISVLTIFGFGFIALSGWKGARQIPKLLRVLLAFAIGIIVFAISGPISVLIPIPLLPLLLTTILVWSVLRAISNAFTNSESNSVSITEAITEAKEVVKQVEPTSTNLEVIDSTNNGKFWRIFLFSNSSLKKYEVEIDGELGEVRQWKLI
jgi:hypothetical protein